MTASVPSRVRSRSERVAGEALAVAEPQLDLGAGHVLAGHDPQLAAGAELGREHLGEAGGQPLRARRAGEVLEAQDRHGPAGRHPLGELGQPLLRLQLAGAAIARSGSLPRRRPAGPGRRAARSGACAAAAAEPCGAGGTAVPVAGAGAGAAAGGRASGPAPGPPTRSSAVAKRAAGSRARQRRMAASQWAARSGHVHPRRRRGLLEPLDRGGQRVVAEERHGAGQHLVEDDAEGVDVDRGRALLALDLLGRQVGRRAHHAGGAGQGDALRVLRLAPGGPARSR